MAALRILLVDDQVLFRKGIAALLQMHPGFQVVGEAGNGREAIQRARDLVPDVILMDIEMPQCDGLEATSRIKREMPHVHIIMLTVSGAKEDLFTAIKNGAEGYLLKDLEPEQLYERLEGVQKGESPISGALAAKILNEFRKVEAQQEPFEAESELTPREKEVLELIAQGKMNKEISQELSIAEDTVKNHLRNILAKLHLQNRIQAAVYAVRKGIVHD